MKNEEEKKSALIAMVGKPNVGKSSLLNAILGDKVSIVSRRPQTTRRRVLGILTEENVQLAFFDTPGVFRPRSGLDRYMLQSVEDSLEESDACFLVTEAGKKISEAERELLKRIRIKKMPAILAMNKIDRIRRKSDLMPQIAAWSREYDFKAVVPVSARTRDGIGALKEELKKRAEPGGYLFESDALTDQPEREMASEIIREKMLRLIGREVPLDTAVCVESMAARGDGLTDIEAVIFCEKNSQKGILIGKNGGMLKRIGQDARRDMEHLFRCRINLRLWVRIRENWRNRESDLREFGYSRPRSGR